MWGRGEVIKIRNQVLLMRIVFAEQMNMPTWVNSTKEGGESPICINIWKEYSSSYAYYQYFRFIEHLY